MSLSVQYTSLLFGSLFDKLRQFLLFGQSFKNLHNQRNVIVFSPNVFLLNKGIFTRLYYLRMSSDWQYASFS